MNVEFKQFFPVLSVNIALLLKVVESLVSGVILTWSLSTEIVVIADLLVVILINDG